MPVYKRLARHDSGFLPVCYLFIRLVQHSALLFVGFAFIVMMSDDSNQCLNCIVVYFSTLFLLDNLVVLRTIGLLN